MHPLGFAGSHESRLALVIGNSHYEHYSPVPKAKADAVAMRNVLKDRLHFHTMTLLDATADQVCHGAAAPGISSGAGTWERFRKRQPADTQTDLPTTTTPPQRPCAIVAPQQQPTISPPNKPLLGLPTKGEQHRLPVYSVCLYTHVDTIYLPFVDTVHMLYPHNANILGGGAGHPTKAGQYRLPTLIGGPDWGPAAPSFWQVVGIVPPIARERERERERKRERVVAAQLPVPLGWCESAGGAKAPPKVTFL